MNKRGRPKHDGRQPVWRMERVILAIYAYDQARKAGEKHSVAISEAVKYIRDTAPAMRVSETEVKRILATWRSKRSATCLLVDKPNQEHNSRVLPKGRGGRILYTVSVGPRPIYPRANAAEKPRRRLKPAAPF